MTPEACTIQVHQSRLGLYRLVVLNQQQEPSLQFNIDQNFIFQMSKENFGQWKIDFSIFGFQFISNEEGTKFFQLFQNYLSLISLEKKNFIKKIIQFFFQKIQNLN